MIEQIIVDRVNALQDLSNAEREGMILKIWMETIEKYDLIVEFKKALLNHYRIILRNRDDPDDKYVRLLPEELMKKIKFKLRKFKIESL